MEELYTSGPVITLNEFLLVLKTAIDLKSYFVGNARITFYMREVREAPLEKYDYASFCLVKKKKNPPNDRTVHLCKGDSREKTIVFFLIF